jgi:hypothetical protein
MASREQWITRSEDLFREVNARIAELEYGVLLDGELLPLICECADTGCAAVLQVEQATYSAVREHPQRFLVAPGHENGEAVVGHGAAYVIVEKYDPS